MRQRAMVFMVLLAVAAGFALLPVRVVDAGDAEARASATELTTTHRVPQSESAMPATARAVPITNRAPLAFTEVKPAAAVLVATLWVLTSTLLLLPLPRSIVRSARRRRAPPFLVA